MGFNPPSAGFLFQAIPEQDLLKQMANANPVIPKPGPGRPKGSKCKIGMSAKEMIASCAEGLGGAKRMIDWAKEDPANEKAFWSQIYPKLVPHEVTGAGGKDLVVQVLRFGANSNPAE